MTFAHQSKSYYDYEIMNFYNGYQRIQCSNGNLIDFEGHFGCQRRYSYQGFQGFQSYEDYQSYQGQDYQGDLGYQDYQGDQGYQDNQVFRVIRVRMVILLFLGVVGLFCGSQRCYF